MTLRVFAVTILALLALASPASAKYLHLNEAQSAQHQYVEKIYYEAEGPYSWVFGHCWRVNVHAAQCGFLEIADSLALYQTPRIVVITLRGDKLYGHTLHGPDSTDKPRFIRKIK
jgi:hypothetical protein